MEAGSKSSSQQILWKDVSQFFLFLCLIYSNYLNYKNYFKYIPKWNTVQHFWSLESPEGGSSLKLLQLNK